MRDMLQTRKALSSRSRPDQEYALGRSESTSVPIFARGANFGSLAYAEMMSVMSRMLFHFDMTLCDESIGWGHKQKTFVFWEKPPLMVRLALSDGSKGRI